VKNSHKYIQRKGNIALQRENKMKEFDSPIEIIDGQITIKPGRLPTAKQIKQAQEQIKQAQFDLIHKHIRENSNK